MYSLLAKVVFVFVVVQVVCAAPNNAAAGRSERDIIIDPFPQLVLFGYRTKYGTVWHCTGTLISSDKVVTTASCINTKPLGNPVIVRANNKEIEVEGHAIREEVAVVFLKDSGLEIEPACLSSDINIQSAVAAGYGGLLYDNQLHATVNDEKLGIHLTTLEIFEDTIKLRPTEESLCVADRGGPLHVRSREPECLYDVVGVLRDWKDCGEQDSFGEYIILSSYIKWIEEVEMD